MKKIAVSIILVLLALGAFTGIAAAQEVQPPVGGGGLLHEYMEQALADKLDLTLTQVETQFSTGKTAYQIALDNGIAEQDLPDFLKEVRTDALKAAVADGVITQAQADRMLSHMDGRSLGSGQGTRRAGCPMGNASGSQNWMGMRGFRFQQNNP